MRGQDTFSLIRGNSQSLQTLRLKLTKSHQLSHLVIHRDGSGATYPHLHYLYLTNDEWSPDLESHHSTDGVPFLALKFLVIHGQFPFSDVILLRGAEKSLRFLDMHMSDSTIDVFSWFNLLDEARFTALDYLKLHVQSLVLCKITANCASLIFCVFHQTPMIKLTSRFDFGYDVLQPHIDSLAQTIHVLNIPEVSRTYQEMFHLMGSLPFIENLAVSCRKSAALEDETGLPDFDESLARGYTMREFVKNIIDYVCRAMGNTRSSIIAGTPLSQTLQVAAIRLNMTRGFIPAAGLLVILALRCPRARALRSFFGDDIFMSRSNLMESKHFAKLATFMGARSGWVFGVASFFASPIYFSEAFSA